MHAIFVYFFSLKFVHSSIFLTLFKKKYCFMCFVIRNNRSVEFLSMLNNEFAYLQLNIVITIKKKRHFILRQLCLGCEFDVGF